MLCLFRGIVVGYVLVNFFQVIYRISGKKNFMGLLASLSMAPKPFNHVYSRFYLTFFNLTVTHGKDFQKSHGFLVCS